LLVLVVIYAQKKYGWCPDVRCDLLSFFTAKEEREKDKRWGPHVAVRVRASALDEGGGRECAATLMVVGSAHAPFPGIAQSERSR
jgi:hypothetical protein